MPKIPLAAIAALAAATIGGTAAAEPLAGRELQARAAGGEFRGDTQSFRGFESHIWRLAPGGEARAVAILRRGYSALSATAVEFGDTGTWRIQGDMLCVEWAGENRRFSGCYAVEGREGNHVRLVGPARWEGTLERGSP